MLPHHIAMWMKYIANSAGVLSEVSMQLCFALFITPLWQQTHKVFHFASAHIDQKIAEGCFAHS